MRKIDLTNFRVATSETAQDINRRIVLNLLRSNEPVSRADLARHSGLQRSTVSIITATRIVPTDAATQPRLRGTVPLVLQKHFGAPSVA
jgi:hypothetical protein